MEREPFRTKYIDELYETKNIEWLRKEAENIGLIIMQISDLIIKNLIEWEDQKHMDTINHEEEVLKKK